MSDLNALQIRKRLGRQRFAAPVEFGPSGWKFDPRPGYDARVIVTEFDYGTEHEWIHASISRPDRTPTYDDLKLLHASVFDGGFAYQVFVPNEEHVNIHPYALHLFGRVDGAPVLPDFTMGGASI